MRHVDQFVDLMTNSQVRLRTKLMFVAAVAVYILLPIDLIPDVFLPLGFVDDGGVILAAMALFVRQAQSQLAGDSAALASLETRIAASETGGEYTALPRAEGRSASLSETKPSESPTDYRHTYILSGSPCTGMWGCVGFIAILVMSPFVGIAILLLSGSLALSGVIAPIFDLFDLPATANIVSSRTIVNSVRGLGQLVTVRVELAKSDVRVSIHEGVLNTGFYSANHVAVGIIEAGVDISGFGKGNLRIESDKVVLTLPAPIVTSCNIDHIDQYEHSFSLLQKDWDTVRQLAEFDAIMAFRQDALDGGILERAKDEITFRLGNFVSELTGAEAQVEFADATDPPGYGDTCYPDPPSGWSQDADGSWKRL